MDIRLELKGLPAKGGVPRNLGGGNMAVRQEVKRARGRGEAERKRRGGKQAGLRERC
jgi:hypothetical protein